MPTLNLIPEELQLLQDVLESALSELRMEIVDTDRLEFKDSLKQRKRLIMDILKKLQQTEMVTPTGGA